MWRLSRARAETAPRAPQTPSEPLGASERVNLHIEALRTALEALERLVSQETEVRRQLASDALDTRAQLEAHEARFQDLTFAVSEGISKVERAENRIRATIRRARAELEEHGSYSPGLDAEAQELRIVDGKGSVEESVQPLREEVASPDLTGVPGEWTQDDLALLSHPERTA